MGRRGLYPTISSKESEAKVRLMMNFISFCDGEHSLLDIAEKIGVPAWHLYELVEELILHDLISASG